MRSASFLLKRPDRIFLDVKSLRTIDLSKTIEFFPTFISLMNFLRILKPVLMSLKNLA